MSVEKQVTKGHAADAAYPHAGGPDGAGGEQHPVFVQALTKAKVPAEMYLFEHGTHGMGMKAEFGTASDWPAHAAAWLRNRGLLTASSSDLRTPCTSPARFSGLAAARLLLLVCSGGRRSRGDRHPRRPLPATRTIAPGPFQPSWDSFAQNYQTPDWFPRREVRHLAHWSAQCVPEQGDWYAREMYLEGSVKYKYHVEHYGHPSKFGFMELDNLWKAEKWEPEKMMDLYVKAGAKYFVALANHHDNFDNYDSK